MNYFAKMNFKIGYCFVLLFLFSWSSQGQNLKQGFWEGDLDYNEVTCPIRFEIQSSGDGYTISLLNGVERITHPLEISGDSLFVNLKPFDAHIKARITNDQIQGVWVKPYRDFLASFTAKISQRGVSQKGKVKKEILGLTFEPDTPGAYPGVVKLDRRGDFATGTILTETGDFRFFEGVMTNDSLMISSFDGAHGFVLAGSKQQGEWKGKMYYEPEFSEEWRAQVDPEASIVDPFEVITVELGTQSPYFDLLGAGSGKNSIDASKYQDKVLLIQIFGTWCPNSLDQTEYLIEWYDSKPVDVEILAVTYEPNYSQEYGLRRINEYTEHLSIPYDVVLGGALSKTQAAMPFPFMRQIVAFPTLVMVDKQGFVRYVHSYFNGPATGQLYEDFKEQFNEKIEELVNE